MGALLKTGQRTTAKPIGALAFGLMIFMSDRLLAASADVRPTTPSSLCEREMLRAAKMHDLPVSVLYAVGLTETGRRESLQPFALNIEGKAHFAQTLGDALAAFAESKAQG
jgi:hypothetical protein